MAAVVIVAEREFARESVVATDGMVGRPATSAYGIVCE
jgi:hypothetical protein